ncbi:hypothetical protein [Dyella sp. Tek66A03]|uniref:hypothetical protein n=1 Tax=Dyella sp. Tek66A03 TaxID=3458298 RepID=UPI00403E6506
MKSDIRECGQTSQCVTQAERVARCRQKKVMMGGRKIVAWLDKETAEALRNLEEAYPPLSMTTIVGRLIKEAGSRIMS